ncbi:hypothetical protein [Fervidibacter sacchari]
MRLGIAINLLQGIWLDVRAIGQREKLGKRCSPSPVGHRLSARPIAIGVEVGRQRGMGRRFQPPRQSDLIVVLDFRFAPYLLACLIEVADYYGAIHPVCP